MLTIEAPTDSQLLYIRSLCDAAQVSRPQAIASKAGTYDPGRYCWPWSMSDEALPF